jgi:hypothetical protein
VIYGPWNPSQRTRLLRDAMYTVPGRDKRAVDVAGFVFTKPVTEGAPTLLWTVGAGPCVIIAMRNRNGLGALGHYLATTNVDNIVQGVAQMRNALGHTRLTLLAFAAGEKLNWRDREKLLRDSGPIAGLAPLYLEPSQRREGVNYGSAALLAQGNALLVYSDNDKDADEITEMRGAVDDQTRLEVRNYTIRANQAHA